jgi:thiamine-phosphate pyrophosphorylase
MRNVEAICGLHVVTDYNAVAQAPIPRDLVTSVAMALKGGANVIQIRHKEGNTEQRVALGKQLLTFTRNYRALLIINDDIAAALEMDADGVHIGRDDGIAREVRKKIGSYKILGVSVNTAEEAKEAEAAGADYVGVTVYPSQKTKPDARPVGLEGLRRICNATRIPVVAIGGINLENIVTIFDAGAEAAAVVGAALRTANPERATRALLTPLPLRSKLF